jgi:hypothetical protein
MKLNMKLCFDYGMMIFDIGYEKKWVSRESFHFKEWIS